MLERIIPFAHNKVTEYLSEDSVCVDMTCGNGNDTLFLAKQSKKVYAFDIQDLAIKNTTKLLQENNIDNVKLIKDSHSHVNQYVNEKIDVAMFNLGYLPKGDMSITTKSSSTIEAIDNLLPLMSKRSVISITVYIGHSEGQIESTMLEEYVQQLPSKTYNVLLYSFLNKMNSPYNILIEKLGE